MEVTTVPPVAPVTTAVIEGAPQDVKDVEALLKDQPTSEELAAVEADAQNLVNQFPTVVKESKAGYRTTEFWAVTVASILDVVTQIPFHDKIVVTVITGLYAIARGIAKSGVPSVEPPTV